MSAQRSQILIDRHGVYAEPREVVSDARKDLPWDDNLNQPLPDVFILFQRTEMRLLVPAPMNREVPALCDDPPRDIPWD